MEYCGGCLLPLHPGIYGMAGLGLLEKRKKTGPNFPPLNSQNLPGDRTNSLELDPVESYTEEFLGDNIKVGPVPFQVNDSVQMLHYLTGRQGGSRR